MAILFFTCWSVSRGLGLKFKFIKNALILVWFEGSDLVTGCNVHFVESIGFIVFWALTRKGIVCL